MSEEKQSGIIFKKSKTASDTLILKVILENGGIVDFRLPGILKSKTRSSFFLSPGSEYLWRFVPTANPLLVPRGYDFVFSPLDEKSTYQRLSQVGEITSTVDWFLASHENVAFYHTLKLFLRKLSIIESNQADLLLNRFFFSLLEILGFASEQDHCYVCKKFLTAEDYIDLASGGLCQNCKNRLPTTPYIISHLNMESPSNSEIDATRYQAARNVMKQFLKSQLS